MFNLYLTRNNFVQHHTIAVIFHSYCKMPLTCSAFPQVLICHILLKLMLLVFLN